MLVHYSETYLFVSLLDQVCKKKNSPKVNKVVVVVAIDKHIHLSMKWCGLSACRFRLGTIWFLKILINRMLHTSKKNMEWYMVNMGILVQLLSEPFSFDRYNMYISPSRYRASQ